ncbi:ATP synthase E chain-domain-containing protein [Lipomyces oligophaga]|uniref:ATP synthase E chain-domain-containing protein n=1 Tax=Lipomyces oligophaga TaxID=45792 RepID=UPI0034CD2110
MSTLNIFRWGAFAFGVVYGVSHSFSISSARTKAHEAAEWAHKEKLIAQAKAEYAKLHPKPASESATIDLSDPNFDFAKYLESAVSSL